MEKNPGLLGMYGSQNDHYYSNRGGPVDSNFTSNIDKPLGGGLPNVRDYAGNTSSNQGWG